MPPQKKEADKRTERVQGVVSAVERDAILAAADAEQRTVSDFVRLAALARASAVLDPDASARTVPLLSPVA